MWGAVPLYWTAVDAASSAEILANRMVWSLVFLAIVLALRGDWGWMRPVLRSPRRLGMLVLAAAAITVNWGMYIWGVTSGQVVETALGYFINPLVTIAFGVLVMRERLRVAQWAAVGIGLAAVLVLAFAYGRPPWLALTLAFSFATYGLIKKFVGLSGIQGVAAESAIQFLPALGYLVWLAAQGTATLTSPGTHGWDQTLLLVAAGVVTAVPLMCFGTAATRVPLTTMGMLQYLAPILQFLLGLVVFQEEMPTARWVGFVLVWVALVVLTADAVLAARRRRARERTARPGGGKAAGRTPGAGARGRQPSRGRAATRR
ncbi:EamA family transporter RarD [Allostreptomyces psammosilenae]